MGECEDRRQGYEAELVTLFQHSREHTLPDKSDGSGGRDRFSIVVMIVVVKMKMTNSLCIPIRGNSHPDVHSQTPMI